MSNAELLLKEIEKLPTGCMGEVLDFVGYLQQKHEPPENPWMNWDFHKPLPDPRSLAEARLMGAARAAAERADPSLGIAEFQGCMKDSPTFFPGDVVATIRKMRDEWDDVATLEGGTVNNIPIGKRPEGTYEWD